MKILFSAIVLITFIISSPCYAKDKWDSVDKLLFGSLITLTTIDYLQTSYIFEHDEYYETNPIINNGVDRIGAPFVPLYFAIGCILHYLISDHLSPKYRKVYLGIWCIIQYSYVGYNNKQGIGFSF
jgi:hypothetical protein